MENNGVSVGILCVLIILATYGIATLLKNLGLV